MVPVLVLLASVFWAPMNLSAQTASNKTLSVLSEPRPAPEFTLPGIHGDEHGLTDSRGRFLLVNFWAVWCQPCRREMPSMERLYHKLKGAQLDMLAIHVGPDIENAKEAAEQLGVTFPVAVDERMALTAWEVRGLPTSFLLDPEGNIVAQAVGDREWDSPEMVKALKTILDSD